MGYKTLAFLLTVFPIFIASDVNSQTKQEIPSYGGSIIISSIGDARTLIPILASDSASAEICGLVFNGLVKYDKDLNLVGDLAQSWEVSNDNLSILFYLKKNVFWHDGEKFTSKDVEFTYKKLIDPDIRTPYSGDFERIKSLEVVDDYTVKVTYKEPFSPGLSSWGMAIMPWHCLKDEDLNNTNFARKPIGTGPYKFKRWETAQFIELESFDKYFEGRPYIDRVIYRIIPDQATIFLELQTKGVDFAGLTPLEYKRQTDTAFFKKYFSKYKFPSFGYTYLGLNLKSKKFQDVRVRQAIAYAIDKQEIIDGVLLGLGRVCTGPFVPESWAFNNDVLPMPYDPVKAKKILNEAGWADLNGDGVLEKDGQKFEFSIITNQGNDQRLQAAQIIQKRLEQVGIKVSIRQVEWSAFLNQFIDKKNFDAVLLGWSLSREPDCYDIWHSSKTREGEFNFISYQNSEVDKLLEDGRNVFNVAKRAGIYRRIQEILYAEQPYIFLYVPDALPIINSRINGVAPAPAGITYNFNKWHIKIQK